MNIKRVFVIGAAIVMIVTVIMAAWRLYCRRSYRSLDAPQGSGVSVFCVEGLNASKFVATNICEASASFRVGTRETLDREYPENRPIGSIVEDKIPGWRTPELVQKALLEYKKNHSRKADSGAHKDDEIAVMLSNARFVTRQQSDLVTVFIRADEPRLATGLAKAYVSAIAMHMEEENCNRVKKTIEFCNELEKSLQERRDSLLDEMSKFPEGHEGRTRIAEELAIVDGRCQGLLLKRQRLGQSEDRKNWWVICPVEVTESAKLSAKSAGGEAD